MLPSQPYPRDDDGFIDTAVPCRLNADSNTSAIVGPHAGATNVCGYRLRQRDIEEIVAGADSRAIIVAVPDARLGQRLARSAPDKGAVAMELQANGANALIAGAFQPRPY